MDLRVLATLGVAAAATTAPSSGRFQRHCVLALGLSHSHNISFDYFSFRSFFFSFPSRVRIQFIAYFINVDVRCVYRGMAMHRCQTMQMGSEISRTLVARARAPTSSLALRGCCVYRTSQAVGGQTPNDVNVNIHIMLWKCMRQVSSRMPIAGTH